MTVTTNALLQGRTARTALIATDGFTDVIELARQARPHLYRLCDAPPAPLVPAELRFAAPERMTPEGPLRELDPDDARALVRELAAGEPEAVAVALLHSYAHPQHERLLGEIVAELLPGPPVAVQRPGRHVSRVRAHRHHRARRRAVAAARRLPGRLGGTRARRACPGRDDAVLRGAHRPRASLRARRAHRALRPSRRRRRRALLAELAGERDVLCFDMGGTSCDACLIADGAVAETAEREIAGRPLSLPTLDIQTVGAGGGSIAWRDSGGALRVGPQSAGADPGPACYGLGGAEPTVTDANLLLGRLTSAWFAIAARRRLTLDRDAASHAVAGLAAELGMGELACAEGIVRVAESRCSPPCAWSPSSAASTRGASRSCPSAAPVRCTPARWPRARHPRCALPARLRRALRAGARRRRPAPRRLAHRPAERRAARRRAPARLRDELIAVAAAALAGDVQRERVLYELRYSGQSFELAVEQSQSVDPAELRECFAAAHEQRYGYRDAAAAVELVNVRVSVWGAAPELAVRAGEHDAFAPGARIVGPAVCAPPESTLFVAHRCAAVSPRRRSRRWTASDIVALHLERA